MGEAAARRAIAQGPAYAYAHFALAVVLGEQGDAAGAVASLERAIAVDASEFYVLYAALFDGLSVREDLDAAQAEFDRLDAMGAYLPHVLRLRLGDLVVPEGFVSPEASE